MDKMIICVYFSIFVSVKIRYGFFVCISIVCTLSTTPGEKNLEGWIQDIMKHVCYDFINVQPEYISHFI